MHLASLGGAWAAYAAHLRFCVRLPPLCAAMVMLPPWLQWAREAANNDASWLRSLRDLAMAPFFGNSIAARLRCAPQTKDGGDMLLLGHYRAAQRTCVLLPTAGSAAKQGANGTANGAAILPQPMATAADCTADDSNEDAGVLQLWVVNTHLDHAEPSIRAAQAAAICGWMEGVRGSAAGIVVMGDLNAPEGEAAHAVFESYGFVSAHRSANGCEPAVTWPSGLQAPLMDQGEPHCADYLYVYTAPGHAIEVVAAGVAGDEAHPSDATLYPSDHLAVTSRLRVTRKA